MKKYLSVISCVVALGSMAVTYTQCGQSAHFYGISKAEKTALELPIFVFPDVGPDTDIEDGGDENQDSSDSYIPSNPYKNDQEPFKWVAGCNELESIGNAARKEAYINKVRGDNDVNPGVGSDADVKDSRDFELKVVRKIVEKRINAIKAGEQLPLLIPVEYTYSTGDKHDPISYMAYRRSILRNDSNGTSYLTTGSQTYEVEHDNARSHFLEGRFKHFSFVEVKSVRPNGQEAFANFVKDTALNPWVAYNLHLEGSGLKDIQDYMANYDAKKELPYGRLYLADIRDEILPLTTPVGSIYADVSVNGRNSEVTRRIKDIFKMKNIFQNSHLLTHAYALDRTLNVQGYGATYAGYAGMPQLLHKLTCDSGATTAISAQYTPIVMDLGEPFIRTSSEYWGTFFNLANGQIMKDDQPLEVSGENTFTHRTAWVGGYLKKVANPVIGAVTPAGTVIPFREVWQRVAEDGFLILPPTENKPITAANLFGGSFVNPEKPEIDYEDGFVALQDFAGTTTACSQSMPEMSYTGEPTEPQLTARYEEVKRRYLGPWNEKFYQLKVWIDENRDGLASATEVRGLLESGVMAMNTCLSSSSEVQEKDKFGNNTKLRSAFLFDKTMVSGEQVTEEEMAGILKVLALGKKASGDNGSFRLMVDIFFKARPFHFLERSFKYRESLDSKKYRVKILGEIYDEDDKSVPMKF